MSGFLKDEQGKASLGRIFLALHIAFNWFWIHMMLSGAWPVPGDSQVLQIVVGSLDLGILMGLVAWVAGPRNIQYMSPLFNAVGSMVGGIAGGVSSWSSSSVAHRIGGPSPGYERPADLVLDSDPAFNEGDEP